AAMFIYPAIAGAIGLSNVGFGIWAGTAIHNTPQVVAAGIIHSPVSGEVATTVKMTRNLFIAPIVILFGYLFRSRRSAGKDVKLNYKELFPMFVLGFVLMALMRTVLANLGLVGSAKEPQMLWPMFFYLDKISMWLITIAMAGIGLTTNLADMKKLGFKGFAVGLITTIIVAVVSVALIFGFHLNGMVIGR
ncbi:MAG: putative sulfate exporter family transporter, partial [Armatimonadetes bacterium]|nr:putative sulfate exporter family transporter [Armatimonadota bacterium]